MRNYLYSLAAVLLLTGRAGAQTHTFDTGNLGWTGSGDVVSPNAQFVATGGNPGGHIRLTDASIGGTWYFVAPSDFRGNKCDAYGRFLRWDQFTSDTSNQQIFGGRPDVVLYGANGTDLVFDNAYNPGLAWTHYDVLLTETAGWRLNTTNGPAPTYAEFLAVLSDLNGFAIRGEYRAQADYGGLDNVVLESGFVFDADADNSTVAGADFRSDSLCSTPAPLVDADVLLQTDETIDSIVLTLAQPLDPGQEILTLSGLFPAVLVQGNASARLTLRNAGAATPADFRAALLAVRYEHTGLPPTRGWREIEMRAYIPCTNRLATAYIPFFPRGRAGADADTVLCAGGDALNLNVLLRGDADAGGAWRPATAAGDGLFNPDLDPPGAYFYVVYSAPGCPNDTATVQVTVQRPPDLGPDLVACRDSAVVLRAPQSGFTDWQWNTGAQTPVLTVTSEGVYRVTFGNVFCSFTDSLQVRFLECGDCPYYLPNAFAPASRDLNDRFGPAFSCPVDAYRFEVYDRWGSLLFRSETPGDAWDGGRAQPGVYLWRLEFDVEKQGAVQRVRQAGEVLLVR